MTLSKIVDRREPIPYTESSEATTATTVRKRGIKGYREDLNLSKMAVKVQCERSHLSRVFRGVKQPSFLLAVRIADYMGIGLDELKEQLDGKFSNNSKRKKEKEKGKRTV